MGNWLVLLVDIEKVQVQKYVCIIVHVNEVIYCTNERKDFFIYCAFIFSGTGSLYSPRDARNQNMNVTALQQSGLFI